MALRNQPYLPLYIQDYLTDEKLNMCSWQTQGIYIKILCILHKQEKYGIILFKQKDKQNLSKLNEFASILIRNLPCQKEDMILALEELIENKVLIINDNMLIQKRMVRDGEISEARSIAGKKGGGNPILFKQKDKLIPEDEYEDENVIKVNNINIVFENFRTEYPGIKRGYTTEFDNFKKKHKDWKDILPYLLLKLEDQVKHRSKKASFGSFVPEWKNLQTWINQRSWEEEINIEFNKPNAVKL